MTKYKDEYYDIYENLEESGFEFSYKNQRLGRSKPIAKSAIDKLDPSKHNNDDIPLFVKCRHCEEYMDFEEGPNGMLDGKWTCPDCGSRVRERTAYSQLERENEEWENEYDKIYNEDFDDFC